MRLYGTGFGTTEAIHRAMGEVATFHNMMLWKVNRLPLPEFTKLFLEAVGLKKGKSTARRRGAPVKETTTQRAEFAKPLVEKGLTWPEIFERYATTKAGKADKDASADIMRKAYDRQYPAIPKRRKAP